MVPRIAARTDADGCSCLDCRNVGVQTLRRSILDALVWSGRLFRARPSILAFALFFVGVNRFLDEVAILYAPEPLVDTVGLLAAFAFLIGLRAYVGTIVAGEITDDRVSVRSAVWHTLRRTPALVGLLCFAFLAVPAVMGLVSISVIVAVGVMWFASSQIGFVVESDLLFTVGGYVFVGLILLTFVLPLVIVVFKLWFSVDACVVGGYGPLESLQTSWAITTNLRWKLLLLVLATGASTGFFYVVGSLPSVGGDSFGSTVGLLSTSVGELLSVVWYGVYVQLYAQQIVDH
ncbi:hypothetical protein [Natrialba swarupiae]|uniref:DUF7847 domain-containing protein n=1 Tax=Natrialba swarupiae TaxID=2448032 RepID=A0A5D5ASI7_9EURY|nr:hypothetical protein [Natrialba swarupiae]TYT62802.1 hypothetical protein FYC77_07150 [Natrialba swarupiae]